MTRVLLVVPIPAASPRPWILAAACVCLAIVPLAIVLVYRGGAWRIGVTVWRGKRARLGLAAVVAVALAGGVYLAWQARPPRPQESPLVTQEWPLDRGGLRRLGAVEGSLEPALHGKLWEYNRRGEAFYSSPAAAGEFVFAVGSTEDAGRIHCFDHRTGNVLWTCSPPGYRATFSSPVIVGGFLYCGEGLHQARQARVVCIDLRPGRVGNIAWSFRTNGHVECSPVVVKNRVYFGAGDDGIYCVDGASLINGSPRVVFHLSGEKYPDAETSLVVADGRVYAGLGIGGNALCVLDAESGAELKRLPLPYPVFSPPAIDQGKLYFGLGEGDYVTPDRKPAGQVCCVDLATLAIDWTYPLSGTVLGCVAVGEDQLYFGCSNGSVYALSKSGELVASFDSGASIVSSPALGEESIFVVNQQGTLYRLERTTMKVQGRISLGTAGRFLSSPVIVNGKVIIGTEKQGPISLE